MAVGDRRCGHHDRDDQTEGVHGQAALAAGHLVDVLAVRGGRDMVRGRTDWLSNTTAVGSSRRPAFSLA
jgi:hypothetical protein